MKFFKCIQDDLDYTLITKVELKIQHSNTTVNTSNFSGVSNFGGSNKMRFISRPILHSFFGQTVRFETCKWKFVLRNLIFFYPPKLGTPLKLVALTETIFDFLNKWTYIVKCNHLLQLWFRMTYITQELVTLRCYDNIDYFECENQAQKTRKCWYLISNSNTVSNLAIALLLIENNFLFLVSNTPFID